VLFPASGCVDAVVDATGFSPEERNESTTATPSSAATPPMTAQVRCIWQRFPVIDFRASPFGCPRASLGPRWEALEALAENVDELKGRHVAHQRSACLPPEQPSDDGAKEFAR
jgi:hypothetical protein